MSRRPPRSTQSRSSAASDVYKRQDEAQLLRNYLDDHIFSRVSIEELSAFVYRSPDYVIKLFRKTYGQTPYAYLLRQKMRAAENLLRTTQLPCREIAHKLKFEDPHYFSNIFKKQHLSLIHI